jgi:hypothetical protein
MPGAPAANANACSTSTPATSTAPAGLLMTLGIYDADPRLPDRRAVLASLVTG